MILFEEKVGCDIVNIKYKFILQSCRSIWTFFNHLETSNHFINKFYV